MMLTNSRLCLFLFPFVSTALVAPPTNVTLTCRNLQNILSWDYDNLVPGLRFLVSITSNSNISGCPNELWVDQPSLQADLSFLSNPNDLYLVEVKAVLGKNESSEEKVKFTYFHSFVSGQKCLLDLPPVNVTPMENHYIQLQFDHPWLVYKERLSGCKKHKKKKKKSNQEETKLPIFEYSVKIAGQDKLHSFECEEAVCVDKLQVDSVQDEHCLKIEGWLKKMLVESTKEVCTQKAPPPLSQIAISVGISVAVVAAVALIVFMVCWKKTTPFLVIPDTLKKFSKGKIPGTFEPISDQPSPVEPRPWLTSSEEQNEEPVSPVDPEYDVRIKLSPNNQALSEDPEEGKTTYDPYMDGQTLDGEKEPKHDEGSHSAYERRPVVELAPEDHAEGYRG
ncbi:growth/differentiation factor 10b [Anableps anableps]